MGPQLVGRVVITPTMRGGQRGGRGRGRYRPVVEVVEDIEVNNNASEAEEVDSENNEVSEDEDEQNNEEQVVEQEQVVEPDKSRTGSQR